MEEYTMAQITKDMIIGELITVDENVPGILMRAGMHCLGCPASRGETLEQACAVHGIDCEVLVSQINDYLSKKA